MGAPRKVDLMEQPLGKKCSSCHSQKSIDAFSGFATCDSCRYKKRKHWGSKRAELLSLQIALQDGSQDTQSTILCKEIDSDRSTSYDRQAEVESLELKLRLSNSQNTEKQAEIDLLKTQLGDCNNNFQKLMAQNLAKQAEIESLNGLGLSSQLTESFHTISKLKYLVQAQTQEMVRMQCEIQRCGGMYTSKLGLYGTETVMHQTSPSVGFDPVAMTQSSLPAAHASMQQQQQQQQMQMQQRFVQQVNAQQHQQMHQQMQQQNLQNTICPKSEFSQTESPHVQWNSQAKRSYEESFKKEILVNGYSQYNEGYTEGSLIDFAFEQAQYLSDNSSGSQGGAGTGNASGAPQSSADNECCTTGLVKHNYTRSLSYGFWFEDPELEQAFQEQVTVQRRLGVWAGWPALGATILFGEAYIKHTYPDDPNHLVMSSHQLLGYCAFVSLIFLFYWKLLWKKNLNPGYLFKARYLGECWVLIASLRHLWFIFSSCYWAEASAEEWVLIALILCARSVVLPWVEVSPVGMVVTSVPLWGALIMVPNMSMVFRLRCCATAFFMVVMGFLIYLNNRQMFVTQMRLKHAHSVTAELKQDAESKKGTKM